MYLIACLLAVFSLIGTSLYAEDKNIAQIAQSNSNFSKLAQAIQAADLTKALGDKGPFTVFAPTNAAFSTLPDWQNLLKPENKDKLIAILKYHVVPGKILASDLKSGRLKTLNGKDLDIQIRGKEITVNNAHILSTDTVGTNGVIHVIDAVLLP